MKLVWFFLFFSVSTLGKNSFKEFASQGTPLDLNRDGIADLTSKRNSSKEQVILFKPSWDLSFQKETIIGPLQTDTKKFRNGYLENHLIETKSFDTKKTIESIEYKDFVNGSANTKTATLWYLNVDEKEVIFYKKVKEHWVEKKRLKKKIQTLSQGAQGCEQHILPLSQPAPGFAGGFLNLINFSKNLHPTTLGLRIDSKSCSKAAIDQFNAAIDIIFKQYLPCLSSKRPELAERIITGLQSNQNRVYCKNGVAIKNSGHTIAYTKEKANADITFKSHSNRGFSYGVDKLANSLFHEILHHHFEVDIGLHNHGDVKDPVYGCSSLCSGFEVEDIGEMNRDILRGYSQEGCVACLEAPFLDGSQGEATYPTEFQCSENSIIANQNRCVSLLDEEECINQYSLKKVASPNFQKCLDKGVKAESCLFLGIYKPPEVDFDEFNQFFDHPNFIKCLDHIRFPSQCMKEVEHLDLISLPEVARCLEVAPLKEKSHCFFKTMRDGILKKHP